jgi:steroid 5-alpha reductase family enzyme
MSLYIICSAIAVFVYMTVLFAAALLKKDNSVVDIAWGPGFVLIAVLTLLIGKTFEARQVLATTLVAVWGIRLGVYLYSRNRGRGEDFRYAKWRREWGRWFVPRSFFQIFLLQGILMLVISYGVVLVNASPERGLGPLDGLGAAVWFIGFFFEAAGDAQLKAFKQKPENKGRIMRSGLWRYTRHPNYFGEAVMWWGIFIIDLSLPRGWTGVVSPALITFLLLRVSGVTMLEKKYAGDDEFQAYARRTNAFFPWHPKKKKTS